MKKIAWKNPNKMIFESEHKTFNKQCDYISTGNVCSNVQTSSFIRPYYQLECNGFTNPFGHLQNFDLLNFPEINGYLLNTVKRLTNENNGAILYKFFHVSNGTKTIHGYILTDTKYNYLQLFNHNQSVKSYSVLSECKKYVCSGF